MMKLTKRKGFNFFRSYYDVYNELENDKDKVAFIDALLDRQFLGIKPTELKGLAKFAYISQTNSIDSQVKGYEDKTGVKLLPINEIKLPPIVPPTQGVTLPPALQVQVEVQEKGEVEVENNKKEKVFNFRKSLIKEGFEENLVDEWMKVRKNKKATNSETALKGFLKQVELKKLDKNLILQKCVEHSWGGFNKDWLIETLKKESKNYLPTENLTF